MQCQTGRTPSTTSYARQILRPCLTLVRPALCASNSVAGACRSSPLGLGNTIASTSSRSTGLHHDRTGVVSRSSGASAAPLSPQEKPGQGSNWAQWGLALLAAAGVAGIFYALSTPTGLGFRQHLVDGPLGRSGFLAAFSLIVLSEIGDKTFFIAALLAMKLGKWVSFLGSVASLGVMTVISVGIGAVFSRVPDALKSSVPIGELAGIALLLIFGVRALREGLRPVEGPAAADEEMADAEDAVKQAESSGRMSQSSQFSQFIEVATLIFIAEWGDRSMLATIALGAAQNPVGVATGAIAGHAIATGIAVVGGTIASKYISEKTINLISGALFILFAIATAVTMI